MASQAPTSSVLENVQQQLAKHLQDFTPKFTENLAAETQQVLISLGLKINQAQLESFSGEIATESAREIFEELSKIQETQQIQFVIEDSLVSGIICHPEMARLPKPPGEKKVYSEIEKRAENILSKNLQGLKNAAVLGQIANILRQRNPTQQFQPLVVNAVDEFIAREHPLARKEDYILVKNQALNFIKNYVENFEKEIGPKLAQNNTPTLDELNKVKENAYYKALAVFEKNIEKYRAQFAAKDLASIISYTTGFLAIPSGQELTLGFKFSREPLPSGPAGIFTKIILASDKNRLQAYYSLLGYDRTRLEKNLVDLNSQLGKLKAQKSLSNRDGKVYLKAQQQYRILKNARDFGLSKSKSAQAFRTLFQVSSAANLLSAAQFSWIATKAAFGKLPGIYVSQDHLVKDSYLAGKIIGGITNGPSN